MRLKLLLVAALAAAAFFAASAPAPAARAAQGDDTDQYEEKKTYPWRKRVASARSYVKRRSGRIAFAVVDEEGRVRGHRRRARYYSASVVKAMLMVAYLNRRSVRRRALTGADRALLRPMIRRSDNETASAIRNIVGNASLAQLARRAGMRDFATAFPWGNSRITAEDQARFFLRIDRYVVERHRRYARRMLASIVPRQRWGIPRVRPRGFDIFFKGGWRPTAFGYLVNQVALLERGKRRIAVAVLTDANPSYAHGHETIRAVAGRLLLRFQ